MYFFYVLFSLKDGRLYKGVSNEIGQRFIKHNRGGTRSTQNRRPLVLIFVKEFQDKTSALKFENYCKSLEGGTKLRNTLEEINILDYHGKLKFVEKDG